MNSTFKSNRGSALISAMIFGVLVTLTVASYLSLSSQTLKISHRMYYTMAAIDTAETGVEEAMWAFNNGGGITAANGWTLNPTASVPYATKTFNGFLFGENSAGTAKVYVEHYNGLSGDPVVVCRATLTLPSTGKLEKWVKVTLKKGVMPDGSVNGGAGNPNPRQPSISFSGQPQVYSWQPYPDGPLGAYVPPPLNPSPTNAGDHFTLAALAVALDDGTTINVGNARVWGTAAVGGDDVGSVGVRQNGGSVGPFGTNPGDTPGVSTDFSANWPVYTMPSTTPTYAAIPADRQLVGSSDPDHPAIYSVNSVSLSGNAEGLTVTGYVELRLTAPQGSTALSITGNGAGITVNNGAGLVVYTAGNVNIAGNGVINETATGLPGSPLAFRVRGTATTPGTQQIDIRGNGSLSGVIYAPNAAVTLRGQGSGDTGKIYGSAIGYTLAFHAGTIMGAENIGSSGDDGIRRIKKWQELVTHDERAPYIDKI